jgi:hypothetical protein
MPKKCVSCGILMDVPCNNAACDGHLNESVGDVCLYCATNERRNTLFSRETATLFFSQRAGKRLRSIQVLAFQGCEQELSFFFARALRMILRRCIAST